jgi:FkbM family methyltransferase
MSASSPPRDAGTHHAAVLALPRVPTWCPADTIVDFLGAKTRWSYIAGMVKDSPTRSAETVTPDYPLFDNEYFEWIDVLETVEAATDSYVMIELGAGYGRWSVRAALAAAHRPSCTFHCVAVEAEPAHFRWMLDHFRDNGVNPEEHDVIWAAVGARPGVVPFRIGNPDGWYGQAIASKTRNPLPTARMRRRLKARSVLGRPPITATSAESPLWVPCVTLAELLAPYPEVDLIDLDVQGSEFDVLEPAIELLTERVRRVHIGTHSAQIEEALRELFSAAGWQKLNDYPGQSRAQTPYGEIAFDDGVQTWLNPERRSSGQSREPARSSAESPESVAVLHARIAELRERNRQLRTETSRRTAESAEVIVTLHASIADLKERNRQLKDETVRLREKHRGWQADGQPKAAARWWRRLLPGWLARPRRRHE